VVYEEGQTQLDRVLKNVVRAEKIEEPMEFIHGILARCEEKYLKQIYKINSWKDDEDFVGQCAKNYGKLLRGGEPDLKATAKIILNDWQRGKIPYFIPPPKDNEFEEFDKNNNNNDIDKNKMDVENIKGIAIQEDVKNDDKNKKYGIEQNINEIDTKDFNKEDNLNEE
jgi:nuclear GTP-binding protein